MRRGKSLLVVVLLHQIGYYSSVLSFAWKAGAIGNYSRTSRSQFNFRPWTTLVGGSSCAAAVRPDDDDGRNDKTDDNGPDQYSQFASVVSNRYACTRFERHDGYVGSISTPSSGQPQASTSNSNIVQQAWECLNLARRAPSGFNIQPYQLLLVSDPDQKQAMARYCCGRNADRVRDSDCTAVFLADRYTMKRFGAYRAMLFQHDKAKWETKPGAIRMMQLYTTLFSSGFPLPAWISSPISWIIRMSLCILQQIVRAVYPLPTFFGRDTWSQKNTMLVAMTYLLGCTSRGIATCPMEGFDMAGIRRALKIPRRYTIPIIVATGQPYNRQRASSLKEGEKEGKPQATGLVTIKTDDTGISHGPPGTSAATPRFTEQEVLHSNLFGQTVSLPVL